MSGLSEIRAGRFPANRSRIQQSILEDQIELWWFQDMKSAILWYSVALFLILGTGIGGIVLISTTTSKSGEWRLGIGILLCLLSLVILFKQLLTSALQDMNCVRNRAHIDKLRSGGLIDYLVISFTGFIVLTCGYIVIIEAKSEYYPPVRYWSDKLIAGVVLTVIGSTILSVLFFYVLIFKLYSYIVARSTIRREQNVFTISGSNVMESRTEISTSTSNIL
ncbi:transmembrane protein 125-like [Hypanus sabinus]|uniref:transmembrane protein 125-like n=1 Tax=Hypanus sabinus TaxID=79690 RepID=UPI0028C4A44D|nr:transmembrane protein 125-like [Hypanus sabinus]XP_059839971.1 transmembrane protein 125-like [Hypanus sabinus]